MEISDINHLFDVTEKKELADLLKLINRTIARHSQSTSINKFININTENHNQDIVFFLQNHVFTESPLTLTKTNNGLWINIETELYKANALLQQLKGASQFPNEWVWIDKQKGIFRFSTTEEPLSFSGKRKAVFEALIELSLISPDFIPTKELLKKTNKKLAIISEEIDRDNLYAQIGGINERISNFGYKFQSDEKGYYYLQKIQSLTTS